MVKREVSGPKRPVASLFDPDEERAACGVGFIVSVDGKPSNQVSGLREAKTCVCVGVEA